MIKKIFALGAVLLLAGCAANYSGVNEIWNASPLSKLSETELVKRHVELCELAVEGWEENAENAEGYMKELAERELASIRKRCYPITMMYEIGKARDSYYEPRLPTHEPKRKKPIIPPPQVWAYWPVWGY